MVVAIPWSLVVCFAPHRLEANATQSLAAREVFNQFKNW
jgi:hypothetical protein